MKNLGDDMPRGGLPKWSGNTHDKRFVTEDTESSQETEYFLNQFFHSFYSREKTKNTSSIF